MKKTFDLIQYYKGIELNILCVTTSKKRFAEILDQPLHYINSYAIFYDLRYAICNENPDKLYAKPGLGGEARCIFNRDEIKTLEDYKALIDLHREKYPTYKHYNEANENNRS